ncbi:MAG: 3-methyl-2-oxobutanoate dehydrogenase subunit beta, partial [Firmicutes bacterium]|nr:3-methyl-2-oxobutanoate dehydrogenase subunit beta [Bacillota bacterium]
IVKEKEAKAEEYLTEDAEIVVTGFGIAARIARNAVDEARAKGIKAGLIRPITLWPFPDKPFKKAAEHAKRFISVELSMGQMIEDVKLATECRVPVDLCYRVGGMIPSPAQVLESIEKAAQEVK